MDHEYSRIDRLLHRFALATDIIPQASFDIEQALKKTSTNYRNEPHVFISGLARAGTTVLMRIFHETGLFRSLTYRDMPFVLAPGLWSKLSGGFRKQGELKERAHGDNLLVDFDSPEAFDEVFWRVFTGRQYISNQGLKPYEVDDETLERFRSYIALILESGSAPSDQRYLSKNNNNILRISSIRKAFPNAMIIVPFRSPVQHANSLLGQHLRFTSNENNDVFTRDYMKWLGHFEFGPAHKPFIFTTGYLDSAQSLSPSSLDYWLFNWCEAYQFLLNSSDDTETFVSYEALCADQEDILGKLFSKAGIQEQRDKVSTKLAASTPVVTTSPSPEIMDRAMRLHEALLDRAITATGSD